MTLEQIQKVYRDAIDPNAGGESAGWWASVAMDVLAVVDAPTVRSAASHIAWWHSDWEWSQVNDSALDAAKRLRCSAKRLRLNAQREVPHHREPSKAK